jgi:hypothetical protein
MAVNHFTLANRQNFVMRFPMEKATRSICSAPISRCGNFLRTRAAAVALAFIFIGARPLPAEPRSPEQAVAMVKGWLQLSPQPLAARMGTVAGVKASRDATGAIECYVISFAPAGYVVAAADSTIEPIISFATAGQFNPEHPLHALVKADLAFRRAAVGRSLIPPAGGPAEKWDRLTRMATGAGAKSLNNGLGSVDDVWVAPLLQSRWSQGSVFDGTKSVACFNYYTPPYAAGSSTNYPCGCVATAWGQIMRYFQYPTQAIGTNEFPIMVDGVLTQKRTRGGNGAGGPYDWNLMPLVPDATITAAQRQAIGALMLDIGIGAGANYRPGGTGAFLVEERATNLFHYANAKFDSRFDAQFGDRVNASLDARLPVTITLEDATTSGHQQFSPLRRREEEVT